MLGPADDGEPVPEAVGEHFVIGRPTALRSNGSVAPVALWPTASARVERFVRTGGFDVAHLHEPLAPMAAYGLVLTAPLPMVGTYHRAGVSRWVPVLKPLAELVGRRLQIRVAVSEAARETGMRAAAASSRSSSTASTWSGSSRPRRCTTRRARRWCCSSDATRSARVSTSSSMRSPGSSGPPSCGWPATGRAARSSGAAIPSRSGCVGWACSATRTWQPVWPKPTSSVPHRCVGSPSAWSSSRAWRRAARSWRPISRATGRRRRARRVGATRRCGRAGPCPRGGAGRRGRGERSVLRRGTQGGDRVRARAWSMDTLAERYVDVYRRAIAAYRGRGTASRG